jgi:hypothetical protein
MVELKAGEVLRGDQGLEIKLIKEIGEGSFAKVFEAVETESQLIVAAKFFNEVCVCVCVRACVCACVWREEWGRSRSLSTKSSQTACSHACFNTLSLFCGCIRAGRRG